MASDMKPEERAKAERLWKKNGKPEDLWQKRSTIQGPGERWRVHRVMEIHAEGDSTDSHDAAHALAVADGEAQTLALPFVSKAIREAEQQARKEAFEEAMKAAHLVAEEYDVAGRKHVQMARKYADMRDGALAAETAIRSRAKEDQSRG